ncbi:YegP family protein [Pseudoxanthomonas sacheonensis]|uniref:Uncharacterized protein YegP (UPF0339 family) n=1 Tax=Pseudoxanthomonas sacheonensis TaxID=443615 RepID=A0ABU1RVN3_9GAMM|nr:DUF1508 domain-containing protein [Pseudoxanthomonas sacheonensis]MDR6842829.1 uncharacterized protein YegP (UPF0339 family) [Pseudoxanthomonas sacheonensis]
MNSLTWARIGVVLSINLQDNCEALLMYFYIFKSDVNNQWYFNIRSANHERIASSEGYHNKQDALSTINVIKAGAAGAPIYDASLSKWAA